MLTPLISTKPPHAKLNLKKKTFLVLHFKAWTSFLFSANCVFLLSHADLHFNNSQLHWIIEQHLYIFRSSCILSRTTGEQAVLATVAMNAFRSAFRVIVYWDIERWVFWFRANTLPILHSLSMSILQCGNWIKTPVFFFSFFPAVVQVTATRCQTAVTPAIEYASICQVEKNISPRITCSLVEMYGTKSGDRLFHLYVYFCLIVCRMRGVNADTIQN